MTTYSNEYENLRQDVRIGKYEVIEALLSELRANPYLVVQGRALARTAEEIIRYYDF